MADEVSFLSDDELRFKLRHFNLRDGPITRTTRKMFERKLQRVLQLDAGIDEPVLSQKLIVNGTVDTASSTSGLNEHVKDSQDLPSRDKAIPANTFYGVCLQVNDETTAQTPLVFTDQTQALLSAKKHCGARFKAFTNRNEAEGFASGRKVTPSPKALPPKAEDPIGNYKAPKPEEIVCFRKHIERGELDRLSELIYGNPKYLISSGDTPVILQEGFRYNAMHVAAKAGRKDVCRLVIDTLEDNKFWKLLYPIDETNVKDTHVNKRRKMFVLDLYLNTPDKGGCETPLHFACKFGKEEVVEYLLSCPAIDKVLLNKYGETPHQVICSRVPDCAEELPSRMRNMFTKEDTIYVPILRSDDNCSSPKIGTPWSPSSAGKPEDIVGGGSPEEPRYKISAYAGPMSPQEADKFCYTLRSPRATPEKQAKFRNIKRSDSEKGLERVARKLAKSQNVAWCEYWKFLDCFADLSTTDGLKKLEKYLQAKKGTYSSNSENRTTSRREQSPADEVFANDVRTPQTNYVEKNRTPTGRNPDLKGFRNRLRWDEMQENSQPRIEESDQIYEGNARLKHLNQSPNDNLMDTIDHNHTLNENGVSLGYDKRIITRCSTDTQDTCDEKKRNNSEREEQCDGSPISLTSSACKLDFEEAGETLDVSTSSEDSLLGLTSEFAQLCVHETLQKEENKLASGRIDAEYPLVKSRISSNAGDTQLFIEGFQPSKIDVDVYRAIKSAKIDPVIFPNIYQWQKVVRSFSKTNREAWLGPGSPRYYKSRRGISNTWSC